MLCNTVCQMQVISTHVLTHFVVCLCVSVCLSICLFVGHTCEPRKTVESINVPFGEGRLR